MIRLEIEGGIGRLVLDRPAARNALAVADWEALAERAAEARALRLLIVHGAGGGFCAGADLGEFAGMQADEAARARFRSTMRVGLEALAELPVPSIAWIEGPCFGAGVALAMACDLRVAAPDARFAITPAKMGIGYPQEDVARLVALVGPGWARRLLFTGSAADAATAERIGLVEAVGDANALEVLAAELLAADGASIAMLKRGVALAAAGLRSDAEQDRWFDGLLGSEALTARLAERSRERG